MGEKRFTIDIRSEDILEEISSSHRRLKELSTESQPREKALKNGIESLTLTELWAIILRVGSRGLNVLELCEELMRRNGYRLSRLERRSLKELMLLKGLGETKAIQVMAVMELIRRYKLEEIPEKCVFKTSAKVYERMRPMIGNLGHEEIWALMLDNQHAEIANLRLSKGGTAASIFDIKILLKHALLEGASGVILCHNHPSGLLRPSISDDNITRACRDGCAAVGIRLMDHVIVCESGYYSYSDEGRLVGL